LVGRPREAAERVSLPALADLPPGEQSVVLTDDNVDLWVETSDPLGSSAATVVAVHGLGLTSDSWVFQRELLADQRWVTFDQRGHGRSGVGAPGRNTVEQLADDLRAVIDAAAPTGPLVLLGHSMGGMAVMSLAEQHPDVFERVGGVVLASTSASELVNESFGLPARLTRWGRSVAPEVLRRVGASSPDSKLRRLVAESDLTHVLTRQYSFDSHVPAGVVENVQKMIVSTDPVVLAEFLRELDEFDGRPGLLRMGMRPVPVLMGASDRITPPVHGERIAAAVRGGRLIVVPDAGHLLQLERPEPVADAVRELLADVSG
jgi:pimeloyl-ACP methyl ester carboxylesterase